MRKRLLIGLLIGLFGLPDAPSAFSQSRRRRPVIVNNPMKVNPSEYLHKIKLPPGFKISMFAENVESGRSMARGSQGTIFVGTRRERRKIFGKVYAIVDKDGDYKADDVMTIAEELNMPNGVAFHEGDLYIAEVHRVLKYENIEENLSSPPEPVVLRDTFPWHGWKFIRFGPDGRLYVPVGAPCNICERDEEIFASITRINRDGSGLEIFAKGIRNTVGFDWHGNKGALVHRQWPRRNGRRHPA